MAMIGDLVVRLSANTRSLDSGIAKSQIALNHLTNTAVKTVNVFGNLNSLRMNSDLEAGLQSTAVSMTDLQSATAEINQTLIKFEQHLDLAASGTSLLSGGLQMTTGASGMLVASTATMSRAFTSALITAVALRQTVGTLSFAFGLAADGAKTLLIPIRMIGSAFSLLGSIAMKMISIMLTPFRMLIYVVKLVGSAVWALIKPFMGLAGAVIKLYITIKAFQLQLKILSWVFSMLPPKVRAIVIGLMALGAATRVANAALRALGVVGRIAAGAISLLTLPIRALISPVQTAKQSIATLNTTLQKTTAVATQAAVAVRNKLGSGVKSMASSFVGSLRSVASFGMNALPFAAIGAVKLAADAETLAMKLRVLTKSTETANTVLGKLDAFAAETPFMKMEVGTAVQQLLSFKSSAATVFDELRMIGDIAAATGIPLNELAEIYGKAHVQGRMFGQDINQLQGRGIPIVEHLALVMGKNTDEIKKMVSAGDVGFAEIQRAMLSMVGPAGNFGGMMAELSTTTAGKFSTFVDKFLLLGTAIGQVLLPHANALLDWGSSMVSTVDGVANAFSGAIGTATRWFTATKNFLMDVGTVAGVVVGNFDNIWRGVFESMIEYARTAFVWIKDNSEIMYKNLKASADKAMGLGEAVAMAPMQMLMNPFQAANIAAGIGDQAGGLAGGLLQGATEFKRPKSMQKLDNVINDINEALALTAKQRKENALADAAKQQTEIAKSTGLNTGFLTDSTNNDEKKKTELSAATKAGTQEAYSLLAQSFIRSKDPQVKATQDQTKALLKPLGQMAAAAVGGLGGFGGIMLVESI